MKTPEFFQSLGTYRSKIQVPGVYIWTHIPTGNRYVGSSSNLARRLQGYFHGTHKSVWLIKIQKRTIFNKIIHAKSRKFSIVQIKKRQTPGTS